MITYIKYNSKRKDLFNLITMFAHEQGKKLVYKKAFSNLSKDFLKSLPQKRALITSNVITPVEVKIDDDVAIFEYIEGKTFLNRIKEYLEKGDKKGVDEVLQEFDSILNSLSTDNKVDEFPEEYVNIFGSDKKYGKYIYPGIVDLNLDNLIIKDKKIYLIDYEWMWDFPIPLEYVKFRTIFYLFAALKGRIMRNIEYIYEKLIEVATDDLVLMEAHFQNHVLREERDVQEFLKDFKKIRPGYKNLRDSGFTAIVSDRNNLRRMLQELGDKYVALEERSRYLERVVARKEVKAVIKASNLSRKVKRKLSRS